MSFSTDFFDISGFAPKTGCSKTGCAASTHFNVVEHGGVTSAKGFSASGVAGCFRPAEPDRLDLAVIASDEPARCAGTFTKNEFFAAPVAVCREHVEGGSARCIVINSGTANAATGTVGLDNARAMARMAADELGCEESEALIASTGVIGRHLNLELLEPAIKAGVAALSPDGGHQAAVAILTTDTHPKEFAVSWTTSDPTYAGATFTVGGMAKGAGMIMPNMATMIACLTTDAPLSQTACQQALSAAVERSFNRVTVDGDTSTNDTCLLLANGAAAPAGSPWIAPDSPAYHECEAAIQLVCTTIARAMAADGEGATKLVTVNVAGAANDADAELAARTVANSPLVKTAIFGHDANWGRIAAAIGRSGAQVDQTRMDITFMGEKMLVGGLPVPFSEELMLQLFEQPEIVIDAQLNLGDGSATIWTCDFSYDYVHINGDYRS